MQLLFFCMEDETLSFLPRYPIFRLREFLRIADVFVPFVREQKFLPTFRAGFEILWFTSWIFYRVIEMFTPFIRK
mgnify:CR=1 FL=1